jgi:hypothetical protein
MSCLLALPTWANGLDTWMRSVQKFPVVIGVLFIIFIGIAAFLMTIERRLKALEKKV